MEVDAGATGGNDVPSVPLDHEATPGPPPPPGGEANHSLQQEPDDRRKNRKYM